MTTLAQRALKAPFLDAETEAELVTRMMAGDTAAKAALAESHLRLVYKIASQYKGRAPMDELVGVGCVGLSHGLNRVRLDKGARVATYVAWHIRAAITHFLLRDHSLVARGTNNRDKHCFWKLPHALAKIGHRGDTLNDADAKRVADLLEVEVEDVLAAFALRHGDFSLNRAANADSTSEPTEFIDLLPDESAESEDEIADRLTLAQHTPALLAALDSLSDRQREIFMARFVEEPPTTLVELARRFDLSTERIRQLSVQAWSKVAAALGRPNAKAPSQYGSKGRKKWAA